MKSALEFRSQWNDLRFKFRVWLEHSRTMTYFSLFDTVAPNGCCWNDGHVPTTYVVMQGTPFEDRNLTHIFEGDVLKRTVVSTHTKNDYYRKEEQTLYMVVQFDEEKAAIKEQPNFTVDKFKSSVVVGNMYEEKDSRASVKTEEHSFLIKRKELYEKKG